jgi:hypothetical protein
VEKKLLLNIGIFRLGFKAQKDQNGFDGVDGDARDVTKKVSSKLFSWMAW